MAMPSPLSRIRSCSSGQKWLFHPTSRVTPSPIYALVSLPESIVGILRGETSCRVVRCHICPRVLKYVFLGLYFAPIEMGGGSHV